MNTPHIISETKFVKPQFASIASILPEKAGFYIGVTFDTPGVSPFYIGQTRDLKSRVYQHGASGLRFSKIYFWEMDCVDTRVVAEAIALKHFLGTGVLINKNSSRFLDSKITNQVRAILTESKMFQDVNALMQVGANYRELLRKF